MTAEQIEVRTGEIIEHFEMRIVANEAAIRDLTRRVRELELRQEV